MFFLLEKYAFQKCMNFGKLLWFSPPFFIDFVLFIWPDGMLSVFQENTNSISTPTEYLTASSEAVNL